MKCHIVQVSGRSTRGITQDFLKGDLRTVGFQGLFRPLGTKDVIIRDLIAAEKALECAVPDRLGHIKRLPGQPAVMGFIPVLIYSGADKGFFFPT